MKAEYPKLAARGDPLMAFWTVAVFGYLYTVDNTTTGLILIFISAFTSSVAYYELDRLKEIIQQDQRKIRARSRGMSAREQVQEYLSPSFLLGAITPGWFVTAANLFIGSAGWFFLLSEIRVVQNDLTAVALFLLPLVWFSSLIWRAVDFLRMTSD